MSIVTLYGETNGHTMQGNEAYHTPLHFDMDAPISEAKQEFLERAMERMFPQQDWDIVGAYWDYSHSKDKETELEPNGHYRVDVGGKSYVVCVNNHMEEEALVLGYRFYEELDGQGVIANNVVQIPYGQQWSMEQDGKHIHLEEFNGGARWLVAEKINQRDIARNLGVLFGRVYNAAQKLPDDVNADLAGYTDTIMYQLMRDGINFLKQDDARQRLESSLAGDVLHGSKIYTDLIDDVDSIAALMDAETRLAQHGNPIEKMIAIDKDGMLQLMGPDSVSYSYFPMMTPNATYDVGMLVCRVLTDGQFYEGEEDNKNEAIVEALKDFVTAYHATTSLELSVTEALDAARQAINFYNIYEVGRYISGKDLSAVQEQEFKEHIANVMVPVDQRLERIGVLKSLVIQQNNSMDADDVSDQPEKPKPA